MRRLRSAVPKLTLVVLVPFLLGINNCEESSIFDLIRDLVHMVADLDERVTELEACDCEGVLAPVCGANGVTYVNRCEARCADISVAYLGECEPAICRGDRDCAKDEFCEFETCLDVTLDAIRVGECVPVPAGCPEILAAVCGCDGVTYDNDCFRQEARVSKAHDGRCDEPPARCGGIAGFQCPRPSQVCIFEPGTCHIIDNMGECVERPDACIELYDPVCGCDGVTYSNECYAAMAGVSIDYRGECRTEPPARCGGIAGFQCPDPGQVCIFEPGTCQIADNMGECVDRPDSCCGGEPPICVESLDPVCGCDGRTYLSECRATMAGVSVDYGGSCLPDPPICGGSPSIPCPGYDQMCVFPTGACRDPDAAGACIHRPRVCIAVYDPVCGCDGNTYGTECAAWRAGVSVLYVGECRDDAD